MGETQLDVQYHDWHAYHDHMGKSFRVHGECTVRGGGFALALEPRDEGGSNSGMLMLSLRVIPTGESPSHQPVEYKRPWKPDDARYTEVGFVVIGGIDVPPPPTLPIEDLH